MCYAKSKKALEKETTGKRQAGKVDGFVDRAIRWGVNPKLVQILGDLGRVVSPYLHYLLFENWMRFYCPRISSE